MKIKKLFFSALAGMLCMVLNVHSQQWIAQTPPAGTGDLYSVFAINANAVAASGNNAVIRTINSGANWSSAAGISPTKFYEIHAGSSARWYTLDFNSGWMVVPGNPGGVQLSSNKPNNIYSLHFINDSTGIGVGAGGKIVKTVNSGGVWTAISSPTTNNLYGVHFLSQTSDTGYACGMNGAIIKTTNGGTTWTLQTSGTLNNLNSIHFPAVDTGYAVGLGGIIRKTVDSGTTWTSLSSPTTNELNDVWFVSVQEGFAVGYNGTIIHTTDGGATWTSMNSGTIQTLQSVHFVNSTTGWAAGNGGTILKYNPAATFITEEEQDLPVVIVYPNPSNGMVNVQCLMVRQKDGLSQSGANGNTSHPAGGHPLGETINHSRRDSFGATTLTIEINNILGEKVFTSTINHSRRDSPKESNATFGATTLTINLDVPGGMYFYEVMKKEDDRKINIGSGKLIIH